MTCSCCGQQRDRLVALRSDNSVKLCRPCIGWLRAQAEVVDSTPILPVIDLGDAAAFYREAGFDVREYEGGGYAFVSCDDESVFDLDQAEAPLDPATNAAGCYLIVPDVDGWHARLATLGLSVTALADMAWGMREFTLTDPSGNSIRFGRAT